MSDDFRNDPQPEETSEVREGMAADDAEAAAEQGVHGSDPSWGPLGLDENENDEVEDADGDPVVAALVSALRSGNAGDAENALALAAEAGHDVSGSGSVEIQGKTDLAALQAEQAEAAEDEAADSPQVAGETPTVESAAFGIPRQEDEREDES